MPSKESRLENKAVSRRFPSVVFVEKTVPLPRSGAGPLPHVHTWCVPDRTSECRRSPTGPLPTRPSRHEPRPTTSTSTSPGLSTLVSRDSGTGPRLTERKPPRTETSSTRDSTTPWASLHSSRFPFLRRCAPLRCCSLRPPCPPMVASSTLDMTRARVVVSLVDAPGVANGSLGPKTDPRP